jgi:putative intracellular protease/amidase
VDGNCITSQGPGTAIAFSLELVELLFGKEKAGEIAGPMVI